MLCRIYVLFVYRERFPVYILHIYTPIAIVSTLLLNKSLLLFGLPCYQFFFTYIYIFTNLISTSNHGTRKKKKNRKNPRQEQEIKVSRITARGKKKKIIGQKERKGQPRPTPWKKLRDTQSVGQKKTKNLLRILQCYNYKSAQHKWSQL